MLEFFYAAEFLLLAAMALIWGINSVSANGYKYAVCRQGGGNGWRRLTRIGLILGISLVILWLANTLLMLFCLGPPFAIDRLIVMLPLLALPAALVMMISSSGWKRGSPASSDSLVSMIAPIQTMWVGALLAFYLILMNVPAIPDPAEASVYLIILTACAAVIWQYQKRRVRRLQSQPPVRSLQAIRGTGFALAGCLLLIGGYAWSLHGSKLPDTMGMMNHYAADYGGGTIFAADAMHRQEGHPHASPGQRAVSVADLTGPRTGGPDKRFELVAEKKTIRLSSGRTVEAWTFNDQYPGPELVVHQGDLVEVKLVNRDIDQGVTVHWHGLDVPNAEDGVAGMTQNAVLPGEAYTYRFIADELGSHWYHSHQVYSIQVAKGLFGSFVILPKDGEERPGSLDMTAVAHDWDSHSQMTTLNGADTLQHKAVAPGTNIRIRIVNASSQTKAFELNGASFKVAAIDGNDIHEPGELTGRLLKLGGGGRYDIAFAMPETPMTLQLHDSNAGIVFSNDGKGSPRLSEKKSAPAFEPVGYGTPDSAASPYRADTKYDRHFTMMLDQMYIGHYNGRAGELWAMNGEVFPNTPTFMVQKGDAVKTTIVNRTFADHPMHLHGHHIHVLSKKSLPVSGSPLVLDTLLVEPGDVYEVAFTADNPGLWMDHCHNLDHAARGMTMHLAYEGVTTPYTLGGPKGNYPE